MIWSYCWRVRGTSDLVILLGTPGDDWSLFFTLSLHSLHLFPRYRKPLLLCVEKQLVGDNQEEILEKGVPPPRVGGSVCPLQGVCVSPPRGVCAPSKGCVCPLQGVCVPPPRGVCAPSKGCVCPLQGVCVPPPRGVCAPSKVGWGSVCPLQGGVGLCVPLQGGVGECVPPPRWGGGVCAPSKVGWGDVCTSTSLG